MINLRTLLRIDLRTRSVSRESPSSSSRHGEPSGGSGGSVDSGTHNTRLRSRLKQRLFPPPEKSKLKCIPTYLSIKFPSQTHHLKQPPRPFSHPPIPRQQRPNTALKTIHPPFRPLPPTFLSPNHTNPTKTPHFQTHPLLLLLLTPTPTPTQTPILTTHYPLPTPRLPHNPP